MNSYDYYISLDWSQAKMAIAISKKSSREPRVVEFDSDVRRFKYLLKSLKGTKILTLEESTASQWLWVELHDHVDEIIVCDPYHNFLLSSGPKNDRIDACKLLELLRGGLLKPVFHSADVFMGYRKLISTYDDVVKTGVRWKNRRSAILRAQGKGKQSHTLDSEFDRFNLAMADYYVTQYEDAKKIYHERFKQFIGKSKTLRALRSIPGIGPIGAVKIAAVVVDPERFQDKGHFWSYCGLVKHHKMSGGRSYGKRSPRYSRTLKNVFKTAAFAVIDSGSRNSLLDYYDSLVSRGMASWDARNKVARKIAELALSIMASGKLYQSGRFKQCKAGSGK
jgi:transposase